MGGVLKPEEARFLGYKINVYDVVQKKHVMMTFEESLVDVKTNHDGMDYGVTKEFFEENKNRILKVAKEHGYGPLLTPVGGKFKHEPMNGAYFLTMKKHG